MHTRQTISMTERIFVTRRIPGNGIKNLQEFFDVDIWESEQPPTNAELVRRGKGCYGLVTLLSDRIDKAVIDALPTLRIIAQYAVGYDNIDLAEATRKAVIVTNTPDVLTEATADLTWALIMSAARRVSEADRYVREGRWRVAWGPELLLGADVYGKTLGIIGMGRIGSAVARRAKGFDMRVLFNSHSITHFTRRAEDTLGAKRSELKELLGESDFVTIHVPLTDETKNLISHDELSLMKPTAVLVNTSRGPVINEQALYESLLRKDIFAAGLDVFETEPTPRTNPLLTLDNTIVLPHIGSATTSTRSKMGEMCAENILALRRGERPANTVNPQAMV
jgi:glyoxylate reductase